MHLDTDCCTQHFQQLHHRNKQVPWSNTGSAAAKAEAADLIRTSFLIFLIMEYLQAPF